MQRFTRRLFSVTSIVMVVILAAGMAVVTADTAPPQEEPYVGPYDAGSQPDGDGLTSLATNCRKSFTSGSGQAAFNWCFSDDGNVVQIENSAGQEHVSVGAVIEGFCVSAGGTQRGLSNGQDANVGLDTPTYPGAAKVNHNTLDGDIKIKQRFVQQKANRQINILMDIENTSTTALQNVYVTRFVDADLNNSAAGDEFHQGPRSTQALKPGVAHLDLIPQSTQFFANSMIFDSFNPAATLDGQCYDAAADALTEFTGDGSMGVMVQLGTILPGETKQVKFLYRISI